MIHPFVILSERQRVEESTHLQLAEQKTGAKILRRGFALLRMTGIRIATPVCATFHNDGGCVTESAFSDGTADRDAEGVVPYDGDGEE